MTWPNHNAAANGLSAVRSSVTGIRERTVRSTRAAEAVAELGSLGHSTPMLRLRLLFCTMALFSFLFGGCSKQPAPPSTAILLDDFSKLKETEHMLKWFADDPYAAMRSSIEDSLKQQVADSRLTTLRVLSDPQWLTGALPSEGDSSKAILVRSGVAFEVALTAETRGQTHQLSGVFTWVAVHLDKPGQHKQRVWMDIDGKLAQFGSEGELKTRVYFE